MSPLTLSDKNRMRFSPSLAIFDLDGTLLHFPYEFFLSRTRKVIAEMGCSVASDRDIEQAFVTFNFGSLFSSPVLANRVEEFWQRFKNQPSPPSEMIKGVTEVLAKLRSIGVCTAIATARDASESEVAEELRVHGLLDYVDAIATRSDFSRCWTDKTAAIDTVCRRLGHVADRSVMFGDTPSDILSARATGLGKVCAVLSGYIDETVLRAHSPDHLLQSVSELVVETSGELSFHNCLLASSIR